MPAAYDENLRKKTLAFLRTGGSKAEAARQFSLDYSTVYRWERIFLTKGKLTAKRQGRKLGVSKIDAKELQLFVEKNRLLTLAEIGKHFGVSGVMLLKRLKQIGSDFKTITAHNRISVASSRAMQEFVKEYLEKTPIT